MINLKKWFALLTSAAVVLSLAACSQGTEETEAAAAQTTTEAESVQTSTETAAAQTAAQAEEAADQEGGTLIAYFSWSGNTRQMAQIIQAETGGDLFEIEPAVPYTDDYDTLLDIAQQEQADQARPELASQVENWEDYDVVFVGYPNWWSDAPMAVYTFLESYDFSGKTLIPFNTSASSGFGRSLEGIEESAKGAVVLEGLALTEGELGDAESEVRTWLEGLEIR